MHIYVALHDLAKSFIKSRSFFLEFWRFSMQLYPLQIKISLSLNL